MTKPYDRSGFTLMEVVVVVGIIATLVGIMIPFVYKVWESNEIETTKQRISDLKKALVGDPRMVQNGLRTNFGYVGDNGELPSQDDFAGVIETYLPAGFDSAKFLKDAWGRNLVYAITASDSLGRNVSATIRSAGPDGVFGGEKPDDIAEDKNYTNYSPDTMMSESDVTPGNLVAGNLNFLISNTGAVPITPTYSAQVSCTFRGPSGSLTATSSCISLGIGEVAANSTKQATQHFTGQLFLGALPVKLPIGKTLVTGWLFANGTCSGAAAQVSTEFAVFIHEKMAAVPVNVPVIAHAIL